MDPLANEVVWIVKDRPVTKGELTKAFNQVANKANWKLPISAMVEVSSDKDEAAEQLAVLEAAVQFFTGSTPTFKTLRSGNVAVNAPGYYAVVGA